jgi:hypothetical protein
MMTNSDEKVRRNNIYLAPFIGGQGKDVYETMTNEALRKCDVYSFGIILYEVLGQQGPWGRGQDMKDDEVNDILRLVMQTWPAPSFRPPLETLSPEVDEYLKEWMSDCWREEPHERPEFRAMRKRLAKLQSGL